MSVEKKAGSRGMTPKDLFYHYTSKWTDTRMGRWKRINLYWVTEEKANSHKWGKDRIKMGHKGSHWLRQRE